jgi:hypothetical protein
MGSRLVLALVAAVAIVAAGGVGFAAFTATAGVNVTTTSGTIGPLTWSNGGYSGSGGCQAPSTSDSGTTLVLVATSLGPSESCTFTATLSNAGTLPGTLSEGAPTYSSGCSGANIYSDNILDGGVTQTVPAGGSWTGFTATVGPTASALPTCTISVTITGTAT